MAIPFYSIDMSSAEWIAYSKGLIKPFRQRNDIYSPLKNLLKPRFPDHRIILSSSARLCFYLLLKNGFKPGDEIIFSAMSYPLYVKIALQLQLKPILVDVESTHLTISPEKLQQAITSATQGIVVTHLFGHSAQMNKILAIANKNGLRVIEDCAQSFDSFHLKQETGTMGWAGIYSCSLMKTPTTLGGGILITKDQEIANSIQSSLQNLETSSGFKGSASYHMKGLISILNSYPLLYSALSHQVFGIIKKRNPSLLRAILYSGMGMDGEKYVPSERPPLASYQTRVGAVQFSRCREMTEIRRRNSKILDEVLQHLPNVQIFKQSSYSYWNYQYHVIDCKSAMESVFNFMFSKGIHVMKENVWDCTAYQLFDSEITDCEVANARNLGLLRIPNNSFLSENQMNKIADLLVQALRR